MQGQTVKTLAFKLRQLRQPRTNLCVDLFAGASAVPALERVKLED